MACTAGKWGVNVGNEDYTDVVKVKTLLRAAGLPANALDEKVTSAGDAAGKHWRLRHAGIVLILQIDYDNTWESVWGLYPDTEKYRYRYSVIVSDRLSLPRIVSVSGTFLTDRCG